MNCGMYDVYHHVREKNVDRYVYVFSARYYNCTSDAIDQMQEMIRGMEGKRLRYQDLIG